MPTQTHNICACCSVTPELYSILADDSIFITSIVSGSLPESLTSFVYDDRKLDHKSAFDPPDLNKLSLDSFSEWFKFFLIAARREVSLFSRSDDELFEYYQYLVYRLSSLYLYRKISVVLFGSIPHRTISIAAYVSARLLGIQLVFNYHNALIEEQSEIKRAFAGSYCCSSLSDISSVPLKYFSFSQSPGPNLLASQLRIKSNIFNRGLRTKKLLDYRILVTYLLQLFQPIDYTYSFFSPLSRFLAPFFLLHSLVSYLRGRSFYLNRSVKAIPAEPFIVLLLNRRPEANHSPHAGPFVDDSRILSILIAATHKTKIPIYIKEHPNTFRLGFHLGTDVCRSRYTHLLSLSPRIKFLHPDCVDPHLHNNCLAVACSSQSSGLEACILRKKTIVFGHTWWTSIFNAHSYRNVNELISYLQSTSELDLPSSPHGCFPVKDFRSLDPTSYALKIKEYIKSNLR